jgi:hypothetical protein
MTTADSPMVSDRRNLTRMSPVIAQNPACAVAQAIASSRTVETMPPWTMPPKPWWSGAGMNEALTPSPSAANRRCNPIGLSSPQPKQA